MLRFYRTPALSLHAACQIVTLANIRLTQKISTLVTEWCFYVETLGDLSHIERERLEWLLAETFEPQGFGASSFFTGCPTVLEIGPQLGWETPFSSTAVDIAKLCGVGKVVRIERSTRYGIDQKLGPEECAVFLEPLFDRMTQMPYVHPLETLHLNKQRKPLQILRLVGKTKDKALTTLRLVNDKLGLGMDRQDFNALYDLFVTFLKRDPTLVEIYQYAQMNSEHSRHHFFRGRHTIDGRALPETLMGIVKSAWTKNPGNSVIAFADDSSAIEGFSVITLIPEKPGEPTHLVARKNKRHPTIKVETHNHPTAIEPYHGGGTGPGGEIRDMGVVGRGGEFGYGFASYCVGNLHIPGYVLPWEEDGWRHPCNLESPLKILIRGSDGVSDYNNCFGRPVVGGFARSFGMCLPDGSYRSWFKPILLSGGIGSIDARDVRAKGVEKGDLIVQMGPRRYRIGMGGGGAASVDLGQHAEKLDWDSVQRADPQMEQRGHRVIRSCTRLGDGNPIKQGVDLGAGGDANAVTELATPHGARIELRKIPSGDPSMSHEELWCNESQECYAFIIAPKDFIRFKAMCDREGVPCAVIGEIIGDGWLVVYDELDSCEVVRLPLDRVLEHLPQKIFSDTRVQENLEPLKLPARLTVREALDRVLRLLSVGSKRFLMNKADRSVGGLVSQQLCVGPNHLPVADFASRAFSYFGVEGSVSSIGEQPIKGLISPAAMARLSVAEALLNMVGAKVTSLQDVKFCANWMWAAKKPGEAVRLIEAASSLREALLEIVSAIIGGKDSLSMAAIVQSPDGQEQTVKAPPQLVMSSVAPTKDVTCKVTPDLKKPGNKLVYIDLSCNKKRLGGSALAQVYQQVGDKCPDVEDIELLVGTFNAVQELVEKCLIVSCHDISDGGLIVTLLEMAFAGNAGLFVNFDVYEKSFKTRVSAIKFLFSEEPGLVLECEDVSLVSKLLGDYRVPYAVIGYVPSDTRIQIVFKGKVVFEEEMTELRAVWEETSKEIDRLQANPECALSEAKYIRNLITPPPYKLTFEPEPTDPSLIGASGNPKVAVIRERGSNGDDELAAAFFMAGFDVTVVTMTDLVERRTTLKDFQGVAFPGGFSFGDVLDAGKGWAGVILFNENVAEEFRQFYERPDTFSIGICNGCQLMPLLGWVPFPQVLGKKRPRFIKNMSGRFESRFPTVRIEKSPSIMLSGMEGSVLGIWVAHGEGYLHADPEILEEVRGKKLCPIQFADRQGMPTEEYPANPNGSPFGIASLVSEDGRHLAIMPHWERLFLMWQWPWIPDPWKGLKASPWLRVAQNARAWCLERRT